MKLINTEAIADKFEDKHRVMGVRTDFLKQLVELHRDDRRAQAGSAIVLVLGFMGVAAPVLAPHDPMAQQFAVMKSPELFGINPLGTDTFGRDMLSRIIYGARVSLAVGMGAVAFGAIVGILMGLLAGYFGGWVDDLLMRMIDIFWAFPWLLIAILLVAFYGTGFWNVIFAVGFAYIDDFARTIRSEVLAIREEEYILAARSIGMSDFDIIFDEVFPNTIAPMLVMFTVLVPKAILAESTLTFLGLGVQPSTPTWGALLSQSRDYLTTAWWLGIFPGIAIVITVFGINLFGDALRDAFDVKSR